MLKKYFFALLVCILFTVNNAYSQSQQTVFLDIQVTNKKSGKAIEGLKEQDFEIYEEGKKQQISLLAKDKLPVSLLIVFNVDKPVLPILDLIKESLATSLEKLKPEDEVAMIAFSGGSAIAEGFTKDKKYLAERVDKMLRESTRIGSANSLVISLGQATDYIKEKAKTGNRKVIINIIDGVGGRLTSADIEKKVGQKIASSSTVINGLVLQGLDLVASGGLGNVNGPGADPTFSTSSTTTREIATPNGSRTTTTTTTVTDSTLNSLSDGETRFTVTPFEPLRIQADKTGGEVFNVQRDQIKAKMSDLVEHTTGSYTVSYASLNNKEDGKYRRIKVKLSSEAEKQHGSVVIKTRKEYFVPKS